MMHLSEIHLRDPFIVPEVEQQRYFLFGTTDADCWGSGGGFETYISTNLHDWQGPYPAFRPPADFWATKQFWAPEVHRWQDRWYLFASFKRDGVCRGTQILVADTPRGPFVPHSPGPVTPRTWECLDGTLFVDEHDHPWIVFCHEWVQVGDGEICAQRLTRDLRKAQGDPVLLFRAGDAPWSTPIPLPSGSEGYVTDGPFLHRAADGTLFMLWSGFAGAYVQAVARSTSGTLFGPWLQQPAPIFTDDGGHGMLFTTFTGQLMLVLHTPNRTPDERPRLLPVTLERGRLSCIR